MTGGGCCLGGPFWPAIEEGNGGEQLKTGTEAREGGEVHDEMTGYAAWEASRC